tara:strand:+ start:5594 stop:6097 length:504 start_codon:yes stop_codon:yes gene_type:complete
MEFLIIILVFILIICIHKEKNVYEPFVPDERQYNVCIDSELGKGETHLSIHTNQVPPPTTGFLSSLLNITEEKTLGKYFNVHKCSPQNVGKVNEIDYIFNHNIIDHSNNESIDDLYYHKNYHNPHPHSELFVTYEYINGDYDNSINLEFERSYQKKIESDPRFGPSP